MEISDENANICDLVLQFKDTRIVGFQGTPLPPGVTITNDNDGQQTGYQVNITIDKTASYNFIRFSPPNDGGSNYSMKYFKFLGLAIATDTLSQGNPYSKEWKQPVLGWNYRAGCEPQDNPPKGDLVSTMSIYIGKHLDTKAHIFSILYCLNDNNVKVFDPTIRNEED